MKFYDKRLTRFAASAVLLAFGAGCSPADPRQAEAEQAWAICQVDFNERACRRVNILRDQGFAAEAELQEHRLAFIERWSMDRFPDSPRNVVVRVVFGEIVVCGEVRIPTGQWRRGLSKYGSTAGDIVEGLGLNGYRFSEDLWDAYCT